MTKSSEELTFVAIEGSSLPHSHAVLIETSRGWHVELEDVPSDSCPLVKAECEITLELTRFCGHLSIGDFSPRKGSPHGKDEAAIHAGVPL
jgi:hypothetical protein